MHCHEFENSMTSQMKLSSVNRRFCSIKHFFRMCREWDFVHENPCLGMKKRRAEYNPHKVWPIEVFARFLDQTDGMYKNLFLFLWLTGCRPVEAMNLRWSDLDYERKKITFRCGKNAKISRLFPLIKKADELLHNIKPVSQFVFTFDGKQLDNQLLYHYAQCRLKTIAKEKYTVYGLRHTFGTRMSEDPEITAWDLMDLMGHANADTSRRYVHKDDEKLLRVVNDSGTK
jgi:integrase